MTARLAAIWRHPIKGHGAERLESVTLEAGRTLPWDRTWAIAHEAAKSDGREWAACANYSRGAKAPQLMAISSTMDDAREAVTLSHPDHPTLTVRPDDPEDARRLLPWVASLMPSDRAASAAVHRAPGRGMTDTAFPSISLASMASLDALSERLGQPLDPRRFRQNLWVEGMDAWAEFDLVGQDISLGQARLRVDEPIERCLATAANPETGERDADTLGALEAGWGHRNFGVYLVVTKGGVISVGDELTLA